jgi:hypothetical protein
MFGVEEVDELIDQMGSKATCLAIDPPAGT